MSGYVSLDNSANRNNDFAVYNWNGTDYVMIAIYQGYLWSYVPIDGTTVRWPKNADDAPLDKPVCGFQNEFCIEKKQLGDRYKFVHDIFYEHKEIFVFKDVIIMLMS